MQVDSHSRADPQTYIAQALTSPQLPDELKPFYQAFERFWSNRLWFQLTRTIESFFAVPSSAPYRIDLYESFIKDFASKLDPLKHASIAVAVARTYNDGTAAVSFLDTLLPTFDTPSTREPFVLVSMERGHFLLLLGQPEAAKEAMDQCQKVLDQLDSVDLAVHASFYRVSGDYWKAKAEFADYYRNSLLYLACIDIDRDLTQDERAERARDLGIAALLGESLYNFGELLLHPVLDSLKGTRNEYIRSLLFAFNSGDIDKFQSLIPELEKEPYLLQNLNTLRQKICVLALIEAVFKRPIQDRVALPFSIIAKEAQVPVDEVEHLVMKALMLNLIRGTLDACSSVASITWVQPRVLDKTQIGGLKDRLGDWADKVQAQGAFARGVAPELFA
ncbi:26S proteasome regulatory subunit [Rhodotorula toruloides]|uniref:BY PROTMAP: gi/472582869/gb/EMS20540.1/ 26S proteasome regulatory subunit N9 [Rhodosporidium toruloides NP11] gi/647402130/emb/CDR48438.1/ RHTO0S17e03620g1_1 [Rhodosporidium toruloides] n=2 Tax=Rhodotorula toruloides TaxID=5286 RepID=A0A0K3CPD0_RHOTO